MLIALVVLGVITGFAAIPINTRPLKSDPHPVADYASAVAAYDSLRVDEVGRVMPDGASLMFVHGSKTPRAIVLVHGLTNSPRQFRELAKQFYARGYNVIVPRLPEHGLEPADISHLKTLTAEKYRDYADRAIDLAYGLGDSVFVIGLSAGGNVAAWIAQHRPEVARVIIIAPAMTVARIPGPLDAPAMNLMERLPNVSIHQRPDSGRGHAYFGTSTRGVGATLRFAASILAADGESPAVRDITVVLNDNDHTIDAEPVLHLVERWQRRDGMVITTLRFDRTLRLPHDVIDVTQRCGLPEVVYPALIALLEKQPVVIEGIPRC
jgi:carboxylesterase